MEKMQKICISHYSKCEKVSREQNVFYFHNLLTDFKIFDQVVLEQNSSRYYYKVIDISYFDNKKLAEIKKEKEKIYLISRKEKNNNYKLVITAINTGKLMKNSKNA